MQCLQWNSIENTKHERIQNIHIYIRVLYGKRASVLWTERFNSVCAYAYVLVVATAATANGVVIVSLFAP